MQYKLTNRDRAFLPFERQLLFDFPHVGWVRWVSEDLFVLSKSPYSNLITPHYYKTPPDIHPPSDMFIEVDVGQKNYQFKPTKRWKIYPNVDEVYDVLAIKPAELNILKMQKPYIRNRDELFANISRYWMNAELDQLDWAISLQLFSCPESIYGSGGIGAQSFSLLGSMKQPIDNIRHSINQFLPADFFKSNNRYRFNFIEDDRSIDSLSRQKHIGKCPEISYNYLYRLPKYGKGIAPIQIPIILQNSYYIGNKKYPNRDITDYFLTALMIRPTIQPVLINKIEQTIDKVYNEVLPENDVSLHPPFDPFSIVKLSYALARLDLSDKYDEDRISQATSKFDQLYREFRDAKKDLMKTRPEGTTYDIPDARTSYFNPYLSKTDVEILRIIINFSDTQGKPFVTISDIKAHELYKPEYNLYLLESLENLVNAAKIIQINNWTEFKYLKNLTSDYQT